MDGDLAALSGAISFWLPFACAAFVVCALHWLWRWHFPEPMAVATAASSGVDTEALYAELDRAGEDLEAARKEVWLLKAIVEALEVGVAAAEPDGTIFFATRRFEKALDYSRGDLVGGTMHQFIEPERRAWHEKMFARWLRSERRLEMRTVPGYTKHGVHRDILLGIDKTAKIDGYERLVATVKIAERAPAEAEVLPAEGEPERVP